MTIEKAPQAQADRFKEAASAAEADDLLRNLSQASLG
jgi:hypothetical protein